MRWLTALLVFCALPAVGQEPASPDAGAGADGKVDAGSVATPQSQPETARAEPSQVDAGPAAASVPAGTVPAGTAAAATPSDESAEEAMFELEEVWTSKVVTASGGVEEDAISAPANVYSVTRQDIALHGWRSLGEVLGHVPGLYVADDLVLPSISVRGVSGGLRAGSRIVKVMIDGNEVTYRPDLSALVGPEFIPMELVERVEIAKGPLSALYGANAFLATVNVITKKPKTTTGTVLLRHLRSNAANFWGRPGNGAQVSAGWGSEKGHVLAGVSVEQVDRSGISIAQTFPEQRPDSPIFRSFFGDKSTGDLATPVSAFLTASLTPSTATTVSLQAGLQSLDSMGEFRPSSVLTHATRIAYRNVWGQLKWQQSVGDRFNFSVQTGLAQGAPTREHRLQLTDNLNYSYRQKDGYLAIDVGAQASYRVLDKFTLALGADFTNEFHDVLFYTQTFNVAEGARLPGESIDIIGPTESRTERLANFGVRLEASGAPFNALPNLNLSAGARLDVPNLFTAQPSFRLAAAYRWTPSFSTKLIGGRAFQAPSAVMLFGHSGFGNTNNLIGNRTTQLSEAPVQPQVVHSVEAVAAGKIGELLYVDGALFFQRVDNLIFFKKTGNNFIATNRGGMSVTGAEVNAKLAFDYVSPYASVATQLTLPEAGASAQDPVMASEGFPSILALVGANVRVPKAYVQGNVHAKIVGARGATQSNVEFNNGKAYVLAPYVHLDFSVATLGLQPFGGTFEPQLSLYLKNALDMRPSEPYFGGFDVPTLGRTLMLDVRFSL